MRAPWLSAFIEAVVPTGLCACLSDRCRDEQVWQKSARSPADAVFPKRPRAERVRTPPGRPIPRPWPIDEANRSSALAGEDQGAAGEPACRVDVPKRSQMRDRDRAASRRITAPQGEAIYPEHDTGRDLTIAPAAAIAQPRAPSRRRSAGLWDHPPLADLIDLRRAEPPGSEDPGDLDSNWRRWQAKLR